MASVSVGGDRHVPRGGLRCDTLVMRRREHTGAQRVTRGPLPLQQRVWDRGYVSPLVSEIRSGPSRVQLTVTAYSDCSVPMAVPEKQTTLRVYDYVHHHIQPMLRK
jgi:hypothetical protein